MQGGVAAGFMTGTIIVGAIGKVRHRGPYALTMCLLSGVFIALFALSKDLGTATGALFAFGGADAMISVVMMAFLQERVADEFRGRIFSLLMLLASGLTPISMGLAGGLADQFGLVPVMLASGLGIAAIACGGFFLRDMRTLD
jgi:DHA3 family macrolide efflux protein-like MFS transporter